MSQESSTAALRVLPRPGVQESALEVRRTVARVALAAAWGARHPLERFTERPAEDTAERGWYRSADGWECPLYRLRALPGRHATPVVLLHGAVLERRAFHLRERGSLASALLDAGFELWMPGHRGDRQSQPPEQPQHVDFDAVVHHDLPAVAERIRALSGVPRALWVGHGLGGQLLWAFLASGGADAVAAGVALGAPMLFAPPASRARMAGQIARLLPEHWTLPLQTVARVLSPSGLDHRGTSLARQLNGPARRGVMVHAVGDLRAGFVRQADTWLRAGRLVDRHDRRDYLSALAGCTVPMLAVGSEDDPSCPPAAARAPLVELASGAGRWHNLGSGWGHVDLVLGERAQHELHPVLCDWLDAHHRRCWSAADEPLAPAPLAGLR